MGGATIKQVGGLWRVVDGNGKVVLSKYGKPADGGGHKDRSSAERQSGYINDAIARRGQN